MNTVENCVEEIGDWISSHYDESGEVLDWV